MASCTSRCCCRQPLLFFAGAISNEDGSSARGDSNCVPRRGCSGDPQPYAASIGCGKDLNRRTTLFEWPYREPNVAGVQWAGRGLVLDAFAAIRWPKGCEV